MTTVETIQNLSLITRLYFRALKWRIQNEYLKEYAEFYMVREELQALGIITVKELKLFDEGSWTEYISRVNWDREQFGKKGILYREDLLRKREAGDLEHIPGKAEVNRIYFKNPGPIPEISIVEQLQELRIDIESNVSGDILAMCKWPGLPLYKQCKNSNDAIQLINSKGQNPKDVLKKMIYVQENYLSCFRMLKRAVKHKTQSPDKTDMKVEEKALAILIKYPSWTKKRIAQEIDCAEGSLSPKRAPKLHKAFCALKSNKGSIPKGFKTKKGEIEAYD